MKLITITNIEISFGGSEFLIPAAQKESDYLISYSLNCYLNLAATALNTGYLKGRMNVVTVNNDNQQVLLLAGIQQRLHWDTQQSSDLLDLDADSSAVTVTINKIRHTDALIIIIDDGDYEFISRIVGNNTELLVQELLLYYLPITYQYIVD